MKKIKFAGLLLFAPLVLCAACGGGIQKTEFQTNWYRNTALGDDIEGTSETLEYAITMIDPSEHNGLTAEYTDGVYTMTLKNAPIALDSSTKEGYVLETSQTMEVKFTFNGKSTEVLTDTVSSRVEFLPVGENLKPVSSFKTWHNFVPTEAPSALSNCYTEYHYSYAVEYDDALTMATVTYTDLKQGADGKTAEPVVSEREIDGKTSFLDNEQILFAMRGMNFSLSPTFRTLSTTMMTVQTVSLREAAKEVTETVSFERNGEAYSEAISAYEVRVGYGNNIGQGRTVVIAKKTSDTDNVNRNLPVRIETPIVRSLGTLRYTLKKATFSEK